MRGQRITTGALAVVAALGVGACEDVPPGPVDTTGEVRIELTSASGPYLSAAEVDLGAVELIGTDDTTVVTLTPDGTAGLVDLFGLRDGVTTLLAETEVEVGEYSRLRIVVEDARVQLAPGYTFDDGTTSRALTVPTGASAGLLLNLDVVGIEDAVADGIEIDQRGIQLILDFDVRQSFGIEGDPEAIDGITGIAFMPAVRVVEASGSGSVAGTVIDLDPEGLVITAIPLDTASLQPYQTREVTALAAANGRYTLRYLVPGSYAVDVVVDSGFATNPDLAQADIGSGDALTGVDFVVVTD